MQVKIDKTKALQAYNEAADKKDLMLKIFGEKIFPPVKKPVTERIKTYEHACKELGVDPVKSLPFKKPTTDTQRAMNAFAKVRIIAVALNEGWQPDWNNSDEWKYYPYFDLRSKSGVGFSYGGYGYWNTSTDVGSRLCYKSSELAQYAGKQFLAIYKDFMTL